jgi:glycyl-tRNA synthetase beta chain
MNNAIANPKVDFLLEIGVEEIPSALINNIKDSIASGIETLLSLHKLSFDKLISYGSPRRLYFEIQNLDSFSSDEEIILRGPASKIGVLDESAQIPSFTAAALSFAKKNQLTENDLYIQDGYIYAKSLKKGNTLKSILENGLAEIIKKTPGKRFMRWSDSENKFTRPIEWISSRLFSKEGGATEDIKFDFEDIHTSNVSFGHRIYGKKEFTIQDQKSYFLKLREEHIILQPEERKALIIKEANKLAEQVKGKAVLDEDLLEEICGLVESPKAILCEFSKKYLEVPSLVLKTVMKVHQRYIPIANLNNSEELTPYFIVISNNPESIAEKNIKAGNEKVIIPRFEDACFFLNEDNKISLAERLPKLARINFQVGNMQEKAERLQKMTEVLINALEKTNTNLVGSKTQSGSNYLIDANERNDIIQAALIAKSDLDTKLVFEFTELQGEIGGIYAKRQGLSETISKAISEQYMPRFAEDKEPESLGGKLIALVDKLDNIIAYFAAGKIPKGSADPFALRRQANGLLQIIIHGELKFNLEKFLEKFINLNPIFLKNSEFSADELLTKLREFLEQRLEFVFAIHHKNPAINKAVINTDKPLQNLYNRHRVIHFMNEFVENTEIGVCEQSNYGTARKRASSRLRRTNDRNVLGVHEDHEDNENAEIGVCEQSPYAEFSQAAIRVNSMAKSFKDFNKSNIKIDNSLFKEAAEQELYKELETLEPKLRKHFNTELDFSIKDLNSISSSINNFFEHVLVNDTDLKIKENRQALIYRLDEAFKNIADFSLLK